MNNTAIAVGIQTIGGVLLGFGGGLSVGASPLDPTRLKLALALSLLGLIFITVGAYAENKHCRPSDTTDADEV